MKKTMIALAATCALLFTSGVLAQSADTRGLNDAQQAEINLQIAKMKADKAKGIVEGVPAANISETVRTEAAAWGEMGTNMGRAVVGAAKEIGVAANEFAETPLGKVTVGVVVYKLIGQEILGVVVGCSILLFVYMLAGYLLFRARFASRVEYETKPFLWGLWQRRALKSYEESDDWKITRLIIAAVVLIIGSWIGLATIF